MVIETSITKLFGIKNPIVNAPMGPFLTNDIAIGVSEAGGLGVVSHTGSLETAAKFAGIEVPYEMNTKDTVQNSLLYVVERTDKLFGVNIRTGRVESDAPQLCRKIPKFIMEHPKLRDQVVYMLTSAGTPKMLPQSKNFQKLREATEVKHFHVAPALWLADKCIASGVDGLVCTGYEGGGHQSYEKVSSLVLLQQVRQKYPDVPLLACGGFASGQGLAAVVGMGGGGIVMGSRFIGSKESQFGEDYKSIIPPAKAGDTRLVTGMLGPVRLWKNKFCMSKKLVGTKEEFYDLRQNPDMQALMEELTHYVSVFRGDLENGAFLLGQSAGLIHSIESIGDIISTIVYDAEALIKNAYSNIK